MRGVVGGQGRRYRNDSCACVRASVKTEILCSCRITGPEVIKLFSCSTQLSMKFFPLANVKMPTVVGILTFMSGKNSILGLCEPKKSRIS